jgi:hypothetical protein
MFPHHLETPVLHFRSILALTMALMYERNQSRFRDPWSAMVRSFIIRLFNAPQSHYYFRLQPSPQRDLRLRNILHGYFKGSGMSLLHPANCSPTWNRKAIHSKAGLDIADHRADCAFAQTNVDSSKLSVVIPNGQSGVKRTNGQRKRGSSVN